MTMTIDRSEVLGRIRDHLSDELELDPGRIDEDTRFKEDLEADSLDLYTLVQELEDTYGLSISDERAARILTVGQAVDFVLAQLGGGGEAIGAASRSSGHAGQPHARDR